LIVYLNDNFKLFEEKKTNLDIC